MNHLNIALILSLFIFAGCSRAKLDPALPERSYLEQAQYQRQSGNIESAVIHYRYYISQRLKKWDRLHEEDPNLYLITIGDLFFDSKQVDRAYCVYREAERKGVSKSLVVDRYIRVARWYQSKNQFANSEQLLREHSFLDQLVFLGELNRSIQAHSHVEDTERRKIAIDDSNLPTPAKCLKLLEASQAKFE